MDSNFLRTLIHRWRDDESSTYGSWFLWEKRLKNFRSIRRGLQAVITEIEADTFGNAYRGSSLETVVGSIAEQRQMFRGADHAFLWKPKLRIPDIYERRENQLAFGRFLDTCLCCSGEETLLAAIRQLDARRIKGLGPAVANLIYFLHPTLVPPFSTAIVNGYNALTGSKVKLGKWDEYLAMRSGIMRLNAQYRDLFSNDLGAVGGFLFDLGTQRYRPPPRAASEDTATVWLADLEKVRDVVAKEKRADKLARESDRTHTNVQGWLRDLGHALGYDVWIAANDRGRAFEAGRLSDGCLDVLPDEIMDIEGSEAIRLIDVLWLRAGRIEAAFEVEHTTSIYSGIVRMLDLALGVAGDAVRGLFVVAPEDREDEVRAQLTRPAFKRVRDLNLRFLPYYELESHREQMGRFGEGLKAVEAISQTLE